MSYGFLKQLFETVCMDGDFQVTVIPQENVTLKDNRQILLFVWNSDNGEWNIPVDFIDEEDTEADEYTFSIAGINEKSKLPNWLLTKALHITISESEYRGVQAYIESGMYKEQMGG